MISNDSKKILTKNPVLLLKNSSKRLSIKWLTSSSTLRKLQWNFSMINSRMRLKGFKGKEFGIVQKKLRWGIIFIRRRKRSSQLSSWIGTIKRRVVTLCFWMNTWWTERDSSMNGKCSRIKLESTQLVSENMRTSLTTDRYILKHKLKIIWEIWIESALTQNSSPSWGLLSLKTQRSTSFHSMIMSTKACQSVMTREQIIVAIAKKMMVSQIKSKNLWKCS